MRDYIGYIPMRSSELDYDQDQNFNSALLDGEEFINKPVPNPKPEHMKVANNAKLRDRLRKEFKDGFIGLDKQQFQRMRTSAFMPFEQKICKGEVPALLKECLKAAGAPPSDYIGDTFNPYKKCLSKYKKSLGEFVFRGGDGQAAIYNFSGIIPAGPAIID